MVAPWTESYLPTIWSRYKLEDIYNADEFGLFYRMLPAKTMHFKSEKCSGGKLSKQRITGLAAANAVGDKIPLLVIGKSAKPRCFKNIKQLPCVYKSQKKSWMDSEIFVEWVRKLDRRFTTAERKVALVIDNCPSHPHVINDLSAIDIIFLPPNTTSILQPMDQGVIRSLKAHYRTKVVHKYLTRIELGKPLPDISVLDAMNLLVQAWDYVSNETIINCFKKSGISTDAQEAAQNDDDDPFKDLASELLELKGSHPELVPTGLTGEEFIDADMDVATYEPLPTTDEEILQSFLHKDDDDDDEQDDNDDPEPEPSARPSKAEVREALNVLNNWALFEDQICCRYYAKRSL